MWFTAGISVGRASLRYLILKSLTGKKWETKSTIRCFSFTHFKNCIDYRFGYYDAQSWSQVLEDFIRYALSAPPTLCHIVRVLFIWHWFAFHHFPTSKGERQRGKRHLFCSITAVIFPSFLCIFKHHLFTLSL